MRSLLSDTCAGSGGDLFLFLRLLFTVSFAGCLLSSGDDVTSVFGGSLLRFTHGNKSPVAVMNEWCWPVGEPL